MSFSIRVSVALGYRGRRDVFLFEVKGRVLVQIEFLGLFLSFIWFILVICRINQFLSIVLKFQAVFIIIGKDEKDNNGVVSYVFFF